MDCPQSAPSEGRFRQTWPYGKMPRVFGDLETTTCATSYRRESKQDINSCIIRHPGEEQEGQDEGKVSEDGKQSERDPRQGEEEEAGGHRGPDDEGGSDQFCGVVRTVQG